MQLQTLQFLEPVLWLGKPSIMVQKPHFSFPFSIFFRRTKKTLSMRSQVFLYIVLIWIIYEITVFSDLIWHIKQDNFLFFIFYHLAFHDKLTSDPAPKTYIQRKLFKVWNNHLMLILFWISLFHYLLFFFLKKLFNFTKDELHRVFLCTALPTTLHYIYKFLNTIVP